MNYDFPYSTKQILEWHFTPNEIRTIENLMSKSKLKKVVPLRAVPNKVTPLRSSRNKKVVPLRIREDEVLEPNYNFGKRSDEEWR